jgi:hypothetical protein
MHVCNDTHSVSGTVWHCDRTPDHDGDHSNTRSGITWFQHPTSGARWTLRRPTAWLWHRILTSHTTACGLGIADLTPRTVKGRTSVTPPIDALVCPSCLSMAPSSESTHMDAVAA